MLNKTIVIVGDQFGYYTYNKNKNPIFNPLGTLPELKEVFTSLENGQITIKLSHEFLQEEKIAYLNYGSRYDGAGLKDLAALGYDIRKSTAEAFIDAVDMLVKAYPLNNVTPTLAYENLGWFLHPELDLNSGQKVSKLLFRCNELLGTNQKARYVGPYDVEPHGDYDVWRQMVINDIVPYPALQLV